MTVTNQVSDFLLVAYILMLINVQRWLGIRLDFLGITLTFIVALLTVGTRFSISPSQTGVVLSYIISIQQVSILITLL